MSAGSKALCDAYKFVKDTAAGVFSRALQEPQTIKKDENNLPPLLPENKPLTIRYKAGEATFFEEGLKFSEMAPTEITEDLIKTFQKDMLLYGSGVLTKEELKPRYSSTFNVCKLCGRQGQTMLYLEKERTFKCRAGEGCRQTDKFQDAPRTLMAKALEDYFEAD